MANALYGKGRQAFAAGLVNWVTDEIDVVFIDTANYTVAIDTHEFLSDIPSNARVGSVPLLNKTNVLGILDGDDVTLSGLSGAPTVEAIAIVQRGADDASSRLLVYGDVATGLPTAANSPAISVVWSNGVNKILKL